MSLFSLACAYEQRTMIRRTLQPVIQAETEIMDVVSSSNGSAPPVSTSSANPGRLTARASQAGSHGLVWLGLVWFVWLGLAGLA